jgi:putative membrane protein
MKPMLGTTRNHFDRVMHFNYGFMLGYPVQEWLMRSAGVHRKWRYSLPVAVILAFSALYEMAETGMALILTPERGEEFVGMQGDMWDAQKDMAMAGLGVVLAMVVVGVARSRLKKPTALTDRPFVVPKSARGQ